MAQIKTGISRQQWPALITAAVCLLLYVTGCSLYPGFFSLRVFTNFLSDNAFLGIAAIGMTFVILSGGIDLSVGAVVGCGSILMAVLIERSHLHPFAAIFVVLALGTVLGLFMGVLIQVFELPPFLVTLAGLFFCRGAGLLISAESVSITHPFLQKAARFAVHLGSASLPLSALLFMLTLLLAIFLSLFTRFGRNVYAVGGSEPSSVLMGLPVSTTKVSVYALSGFCSAFAAVVYTLYTSSGNATAGVGLELDAIAAVVIGGTLLSGGVGYILGTLIGVLIFGIIQTGISFQGTLSSWWTKIAIGLLLLIFIVLQKVLNKHLLGRR